MYEQKIHFRRNMILKTCVQPARSHQSGRQSPLSGEKGQTATASAIERRMR
jgi:hypothetical protein